MGLSPDLWGPSFWSTIHLLCLGASKEISDMQKIQYMAFFNALPYVIPCGTCSQHLLENYKKLPLENYLESQTSLFRWSVLLHNEVNRSLNKPVWSEEDARRHWEKKTTGTYSNETSSVSSRRAFWMIVLTILLIVCVIAGIVYWIRRHKK
jgi:hypothetical protein